MVVEFTIICLQLAYPVYLGIVNPGCTDPRYYKQYNKERIYYACF